MLPNVVHREERSTVYVVFPPSMSCLGQLRQHDGTDLVQGLPVEWKVWIHSKSEKD